MKSSLLRRFGAAVVLSLWFASFLAGPGSSFAESPAGELAHGARAEAGDGTMVVYDRVIGSYRVPPRLNVYWFGERFYLYENGVWLTASKLAGPWDVSAIALVPVPLRVRYTPPKKKISAKMPWGAEVVFDPTLKAYKVAGKAGVFLFDGRFYRYDGGVWMASGREDGPWALTSVKGLSPALRRAVGKPEHKTAVILPTGETVIYDAASGVFRLDGKTDTFLVDGSFYEKREAKWLASSKAAADYEDITSSKVPAPLRVLYRSKDAKPGAKGANKKPAGNKATSAAKAKPTAQAKAAAQAKAEGRTSGKTAAQKSAKGAKSAGEPKHPKAPKDPAPDDDTAPE